jgi:hypothetical protein
MIRILSNYARLLLTFALGIILVRMMAEIGPDAALIYMLLISSTGIAAMFKFALQNALVPALGLTIDGRGPHAFQTVLWTSFVAGLAAGAFSLVLFGLFWLFSDSMNFGTLNERTIAIALMGTSVQAFASSVGTSALNLILVERRILLYNILLVLERLVVFLAALAALLLPAPTGVDERLQVFYVLVGLTSVLLQGLTMWLSSRRRPDLRLRRTALQRTVNLWIAALVGWNAVVVIAFAFFTRWPPLVVNWAEGETMTLTIAIVLTLIGYQRQLSMGLVVGLDAAVSRMVGGDRDADARRLAFRSTYLLAVFSAFSVAGVGLLAKPLLILWFGDSLTGTGWSPDLSAELFHIMSFGIAASILSEGWMKFLSGRGEVRSYAPHLFIAGLANMAAVLIAAVLWDGEAALRIMAFCFSASFLVVNLGFLAVTVARRIDISFHRFLGAILLPAAGAALAALPGIYFHREGWTVGEAVLSLSILTLAGVGLVLAMKPVLRRLAG